MSIAVVRFPGTNNEREVVRVLEESFKQNVTLIPSHAPTELARHSVKGIVLPGGFSYGDYLRPGALAAFSECFTLLKERAATNELPILGICNGFQMLTEAGLLEGVLLRNISTRFICRRVHCVIPPESEIYGKKLAAECLQLPIAHNEGNFYCSAETLARLQDENQIVLRYSNMEGVPTQETNPNGSIDSVAGIRNEAGNVFGLMPHPERASDAMLGSQDGLKILNAFVEGCTC